MRATRSRWGLAAMASLFAGCGPSTEDVGVAALVAMPVTFLAIALPPLALRRLREGRRVRADDDLRPAQMGFAAACGFALLGLARATSTGWDGELVGMAAFATASAGMLYGPIVWLIVGRGGKRFGRFAFPTLLVMQGIPATLFAFHDPLGLGLSHDAGQSFAFFAWIVPGYFFVPPVLFFAVTAGIFVYRRRQEEQLRGG